MMTFDLPTPTLFGRDLDLDGEECDDQGNCEPDEVF